MWNSGYRRGLCLYHSFSTKWRDIQCSSGISRVFIFISAALIIHLPGPSGALPLGPRQSRSIPESAGLRRDYGRYFWYGRQHHLWDGCEDLVSGWGMLNTEPSGSTRVYIQARTEFSNTRAVHFSDHPWFLETRAPSTTPQSAGPPGARSQERFEEPASWWGLQKAGPAARPAQHLAPPITRNPGSRALILCVYTVYDYLTAFSFVASHYYFYQHWNIYIKLDFKSYFGETVPCK